MRRRLGERLARNVAGRRRCAAIDRPLVVGEAALPGGPAIEEAMLGGFRIVGDHDIELAPFARATASSAAGWPLRAPSEWQSGHRRRRSCRGWRRAPTCPNLIAIVRAIQPISTSHSRCQSSQITVADRGPEMEAVTNKDEFVGRREIGAAGHGSMHCVDPHRNSPPRTRNANRKSAAELTLGGRHFTRRARIDRDRGTKRPRQTLEAGLGDMMAILAI